VDLRSECGLRREDKVVDIEQPGLIIGGIYQTFQDLSCRVWRQTRYDAAMRPQFRAPPVRRVPPAVRKLDRPVLRARPVMLPEDRAPASTPASASGSFSPDAYQDYGRFLTPEGGILIIYKDLDLRWRHTFWRIFAYSAATGGEFWYLLWTHHSPVQSAWLNFFGFVALAVINWIIVAKPVEVYRQVEIRPDCLIVEGDVFWLSKMECGWPAFQPDDEGNQVLFGIYGSRWVEYLTVRRFDEFDRMPEVFTAHFQEAATQLWARAPEFH
jgi:hypothetical protein